MKIHCVICAIKRGSRGSEKEVGMKGHTSHERRVEPIEGGMIQMREVHAV